MRKLCGVVLLSLVLMISSVACGNNDKKEDAKTQEFNASSIGHIREQAHPDSNKKISEDIAKQLGKVKDLQKATILVHDRDVLIGLDVKKGRDKGKAGKQVLDAVKQIKPGYNVHVTTNRSFHERIQRLHSKMDGHPIRNLSDEIKGLVEDIGLKKGKS